jgi:hypothetical protein
MLEYEVNLPPGADLSEAELLIEMCCASEGLRMTLKGSLSKYPGSVHWHFKRDDERGTLEVTLWSRARRVWFSIQAGRTGNWIEESIMRVSKALERNLSPKSL